MTERITGKVVDTAVKYGPTAAKYGGAMLVAGAAYAGASIAALTLENHRRRAHKSAKPHPQLSKVIEADQRSIGMDTTVWASVHREPHHGHPDITLFPQYQIAQVVHWLEQNPDHEDAQGITIPHIYEGLDPGVDKFSFEEVMEVGNLAIREVKDHLKDDYVEPSFTRMQIEHTLYNTEPRYFYPPVEEAKKRHKGPYTQDEEAWFILSDAHSPALEPPVNGHHNGVKALGKNMVSRYKKHSDYYKDMPSRKPEDLKHPYEVGLKGDEQPENKTKNWPYVAGSIAALGVASLAARRKLTPKDVAIAAAMGGIIKGAATYGEVKGGKTINKIGHMGRVNSLKQFIKGNFAKDYKIELNEGGGYETDASAIPIVGRIIDAVTGDEANQESHHLFPHKPDFNKYHDADEEIPPEAEYYENKGDGSLVARFVDSPWGTTIKAVSESGSPLIEPGDGFDVAAGQFRPDTPTRAVRVVRAIRLDQLHGKRPDELVNPQAPEQDRVPTRGVVRNLWRRLAG